MNTWQLQDAKNQLSTVVEKALHEGVQTITRHGEPAVIVMSVKDYEKMKPQKRIAKLFRGLKGANLKLSRSKDMGRRVEL